MTYENLPEMRPPMDTQSELEPIREAAENNLDALGAKYGVGRLFAEPDSTFRERVQEAMQVRRASERAERGESLFPDDTSQATIESMLRADNEKLRGQLEDLNTRMFEMRVLFVDIKQAVKRGDWEAIVDAVAKGSGI